MAIFCYTLCMNDIIHNIEELELWTDNFLKHLDQKELATIITLSGDLGAGKTALVKEAAKHLGLSENITSPTFVIQKEYEIESSQFGFKKMIHIDAYRLESSHELEILGWNDIILDPQNIIFIEWPGQVGGIAMPQVCRLEITITENETRTIRKIES